MVSVVEKAILTSDLGLTPAEIPAYRPSLGRRRSRPDRIDIAAAAVLAGAARRPILWCGSGAYAAGAGAQGRPDGSGPP